MVGCISIVTDYDKEKYNSDSDVEFAIKDNCTALLQKCLDSLPENRSVMKSDKQQIAEKFEQELSLRWELQPALRSGSLRLQMILGKYMTAQ